MRLCDLTGQRFGKLLVTGREGATPSGYALWRCRCDCGNEIVVESRRLRRGSIKDCGCGGKCQMRRDLTGRVFGQVTALEPTTHRTEDGDVIWKCRCGCGKEFETSSRKLLRGSVKDCGCKLNLTPKWIGRRFGDLTVREASLPTDYDIALLRDAHAGSGDGDGREDAVNAVMAMLSALSLALLRQGLAHTVVCKDAEGAHVQRIDSLAEFEDMMDTVLSLPLEAGPPHDMDAFNQVRTAYGITKTMLVTDTLHKDALDELAGMTDLSVVHIGEAAQTGADDGGRYLLTHIPAEAVRSGRIKTLEL